MTITLNNKVPFDYTYLSTFYPHNRFIIMIQIHDNELLRI